MTPLEELEALADPAKAAGMAAYHKVARPYLGVPVPAIEALTDRWRAELSLEDRLALADDLWRTNIHEARVAAAKLLTQARIRPDEAAWALIRSWVPLSTPGPSPTMPESRARSVWWPTRRASTPWKAGSPRPRCGRGARRWS